METWVGSPKLIARPPLCSTKFPWKKHMWHHLHSLDGAVGHAATSSLATAPRDTQLGRLALAWVVSGSRPRLSWPRPPRSRLSDKAPATSRRQGCSSRRWECRKKGHKIQWDLEHDLNPLQDVPHSPQPHHPHGRGTFPPKNPALPSPPALSIIRLCKSPCQKPFLRFSIPGLGSAEEQNRNPSCAHKPHRKIIQKSAKEPCGGSAVTSAFNQATGTIPSGPRDLCHEGRENPVTLHIPAVDPGTRQ